MFLNYGSFIIKFGKKTLVKFKYMIKNKNFWAYWARYLDIFDMKKVM